MATRRAVLARGLALAGVVLTAPPRVVGRGSGRADTLAAAWDDAAGRHHVGVLALGRDRVWVERSLEVPTRAHGLVVEPGGSVLALARRPGDWLLRWWPAGGRPPQWCWTEADRRVTGHAAASADGRRLYTGEADLDSGAGLVAVRDSASLDKLAEWPSHGIDVHQMLLDGDGTLLVANGGVPTRPETGRLKVPPAALDSSLVRLDAATGERRGQWRLADRHLSLRHLARHGPLLGIALQSEHPDEHERAAAPLLALFDGDSLSVHAAGVPLSGYGGDICATADGWAVSATRQGAVALYDAAGRFAGLQPLPEACALALRDGRPCMGGRDDVIGPQAASALPLPGLRLDNHWQVVDG